MVAPQDKETRSIDVSGITIELLHSKDLGNPMMESGTGVIGLQPFCYF